ncbi:hypothetical protein N7455_006054, partial [Penicillium solitum]|uniref:uncharacterized protein n=1 Tax=Penicillium solitum TaxID=60172 RepID=UPI0032C3EDF0
KFTHDLGISPVPSNSEINPPKPQPLETYSYPTPQYANTRTFDYILPPASGLEGSTLHNTSENVDGIGMGLPLAESAIFISQTAEQSLSPYMVDNPTEENQYANPSLSLEAL